MYYKMRNVIVIIIVFIFYRPDGCNGCRDTWYVDNKLVDCFSNGTYRIRKRVSYLL